MSCRAERGRTKWSIKAKYSLSIREYSFLPRGVHKQVNSGIIYESLGMLSVCESYVVIYSYNEMMDRMRKTTINDSKDDIPKDNIGEKAPDILH